ncbi:hypothetical protein JOM56_012761 [Amanita muscaria]
MVFFEVPFYFPAFLCVFSFLKTPTRLIFASFCQADGSTTREYGTVGLSISKWLVNLMQGNIKNQGARVEALYDVVHEVGSLSDKEKCPHFDTIVVDSLSIEMIIEALRRRNVLGNTNISDIPKVVLLTPFVAKVEHVEPLKIPEKRSHSVEIAENGTLAVDAYKARVLQTRPFDIILMDVSMPFREVWKQRS